MLTEVNDFNDIRGYDEAYDQCFKGDETNTNWSMVIKFNTWFYGLMCLTTMLTMIGSFWLPLAICSLIGMCCSPLPHIAMIMVTGYYRYSEIGEDCATADHLVGKSIFEEHAEKLQVLFIL